MAISQKSNTRTTTVALIFIFLIYNDIKNLTIYSFAVHMCFFKNICINYLIISHNVFLSYSFYSPHSFYIAFYFTTHQISIFLKRMESNLYFPNSIGYGVCYGVWLTYQESYLLRKWPSLSLSVANNFLCPPPISTYLYCECVRFEFVQAFCML